jgi:hypothetical protein
VGEKKIALEQLALETRCEECKGEQGFQVGDCWFKCERCGGTGYLLTEFGKSVARMVMSHMRVNSDDDHRDKRLYVATP